jgi:hypothetical protein
MSSELDAIQERLRVLKRNLDARRSVVAIDDEIAAGHILSMNPLTAGDGKATGASGGSSA